MDERLLWEKIEKRFALLEQIISNLKNESQRYQSAIENLRIKLQQVENKLLRRGI